MLLLIRGVRVCVEAGVVLSGKLDVYHVFVGDEGGRGNNDR